MENLTFTPELQGENSTSLPVPTGGSTPTWYLSQQLLNYSLQVVVILVGMVTNLVNMAVFSKTGLSDSVTVAFFALSVSDFLHLAAFLVVRLLSILQFELGVQSSVVRLANVGGFLGWVSVYFMDVSMYITTFTTFQKCCCVAFPLAFKNMFTKTRSDMAMVFIYTVTMIIFLPVFLNIFYAWFFDKTTKYKPLNWLVLNTSTEATVWRWMHRITLTIFCQVVVVASLVVITTKLKQSVQFRLLKKADTSASEAETKGKAEDSHGIGMKEYRAIQAVQVIAFIFIVSTLPASANSLATVVYPQINLPQNQTLFYTLVSVVYFGGTINASVNILVYLKYNRKYRSMFLSIFRRQQEVMT